MQQKSFEQYVNNSTPNLNDIFKLGALCVLVFIVAVVPVVLMLAFDGSPFYLLVTVVCLACDSFLVVHLSSNYFTDYNYATDGHTLTISKIVKLTNKKPKVVAAVDFKNIIKFASTDDIAAFYSSSVLPHKVINAVATSHNKQTLSYFIAYILHDNAVDQSVKCIIFLSPNQELCDIIQNGIEKYCTSNNNTNIAIDEVQQ